MISQNGINLIKEFEGCRLKTYKDAVGVPTIGYGHTKGVKMGQTITQAEADKMLLDDIDIYYKNVMKYDSVYHWNQNQIDALTSFAFNIGSIDQLCQNGKRTIDEIESHITAYNKAGGKVLEGLTRRRKAEKELFCKKADSAKKKTQSVNTTTKKEKGGKSAQTQSQRYVIGKVYTVVAKNGLNVRRGAGLKYQKLTYAALSPNARKHANMFGALLYGTKVTCQGIETHGDEIWMRIPSGWVCAKYGDSYYVK